MFEAQVRGTLLLKILGGIWIWERQLTSVIMKQEPRMPEIASFMPMATNVAINQKRAKQYKIP